MLLVRENQKGEREIGEPECLLLVRENQKRENRGAIMFVIGEGEPEKREIGEP